MAASNHGNSPAGKYQMRSTVVVDFVEEFDQEPAFVTGMVLNRSGSLLAACSTKRLVHLFDAQQELSPVRELAGHDKMITDLVASSLHDHLLATSSYDSRVVFWDARQEAPALVVQHPGAKLTCLAIEGGASGTLLAAADPQSIFFTDVRCSGGAASFAPLAKLSPHSDEISCVKFHPVQRGVVWSSSFDGLLCSHDTAELKAKKHDSLLAILPVEEPVRSFGFFGKEGEYLHAETFNHNASLWRLSDEECIVNWRSLREDLAARCPLPVDQLLKFCAVESQLMLMCASFDGEVSVWRVAMAGDREPSLQPFATLTNVHNGIVRDVIWRERRKILTGGEDARIVEWQYAPNPPASEQNQPRRLIPSSPELHQIADDSFPYSKSTSKRL